MLGSEGSQYVDGACLLFCIRRFNSVWLRCTWGNVLQFWAIQSFQLRRNNPLVLETLDTQHKLEPEKNQQNQPFMIFSLTVALCNRGRMRCCEGCCQVWAYALLVSLLDHNRRYLYAPFPFSGTLLSVEKKLKHATDTVTFQNYFGSLSTLLLDKHPLSHIKKDFCRFNSDLCSSEEESGTDTFMKIQLSFFSFRRVT